MVWNSTQSALYKAVNRFNNDDFSNENQSQNEGFFSDQKKRHFHAKNHAENQAKKPSDTAFKNDLRHSNENVRGKSCKNPCQNRSRAHSVSPDPLSRILNDNDLLLIAGLIFVLMRENADQKLILALAIVLFG